MTQWRDTLPKRASAPWSPKARASVEDGQRATGSLIRFQAVDTLKRVMDDYIEGRITGRAVLVAGHRGTGKTTGLLSALQEIQDERRSSAEARGRRPLLVRIHGPTLIVSGAKGENDDSGRLGSEVALRFLREIAAGILPALLQEIEYLLELLGKERREATKYQKSELGDLQMGRLREFSAHLIDELPRGLPLAELRRLYQALGVVDDGLTNTNGFTELTAIQAAVDAYMVVTGDLDWSRESGKQQSDELRQSLGFSLPAKELSKSLGTVAAAVVAAFGANAKHPGATFAAAALLLVSGFVFSASRTRKHNANSSQRRIFKHDNSLESLVRKIPLLVERLRTAGFPPIFVVDELDKLDALGDTSVENLLSELLGTLKSHLTERSLLFFLADRQYYDSVTQTDAEHGSRYPAKHTFFGEKVYLIAAPGEIHRFLRQQTGEATRIEKRELDAAPQAEQAFNFTLLRHALLFRSRMHTYDIHVELDRSLHNGELKSAHGSPGRFVRTRKLQCQAFFQLCFEWILSDPEQQLGMGADPYYEQRLRDLLYLVGDLWSQAKPLKHEHIPAASEPLEPSSAVHQQTLLRRATARLSGYLSEPGRLAEVVASELNDIRIDNFLGGDGATQKQKKNSPKLNLLRQLCAELPAIIKDMESPPLLDPQGYSKADRPAISPEGNAVLNRLAKLRGLEELEPLPFEALWEHSGAQRSIEALDVAVKAIEDGKYDAEHAHFDTAREFVHQAKVTEQLILLLRYGCSLLAAIRQQLVSEEDLDWLTAALDEGSTAERLSSACELVGKLIELYQVPDSRQLKNLLASDYKQPQLDTGGASTPINKDTVRLPKWPEPGKVLKASLPFDTTAWLASVTRRLLDLLSPRNRGLGTLYKDAGLPDLRARIEGSMPGALDMILRSGSKEHWSALQLSEVIAAPSLENSAVTLIARALLGHRAYVEEQVRAGCVQEFNQTYNFHPRTRRRLKAWIESERTRLAEQAPSRSVLLLISDPAKSWMSRWQSVEGHDVTAMLASTFDADLEEFCTSFDIVFFDLPSIPQSLLSHSVRFVFVGRIEEAPTTATPRILVPLDLEEALHMVDASEESPEN